MENKIKRIISTFVFPVLVFMLMPFFFILDWYIWYRMKKNRVTVIDAPHCSLGYDDHELPIRNQV